jgi:ribosomal protein L37AE/L43A
VTAITIEINGETNNRARRHPRHSSRRTTTMTNEQTMTEFKCQDCGRSVDVVDCTGGYYSCLRCVNVSIRANNAQHQAEQDYETFLDRGGRVS